MAKKKKDQIVLFDLEKQLLTDFRLALEDTVGLPIPELRIETSLIHDLSVNSLTFLEALQITSDKYDVFVSTEELNGTVFVGRVVFLLKTKILQKYNGDLVVIEKIAKEKELNLAGSGVRPPALLSKFVVRPQESKKRR